MRLISLRVVVACGLVGGMAAACAAQAYTPPPPPLTTLPPCPVDKDTKKRAKRKDCDPTVYPSETVETKGKKKLSDPGVAAPSTDQHAVTPAAQAHPYPGDTSGGIPAPDAPAAPEALKKAPAAPSGGVQPYPGDNGKDVPYNPADDPEEKGKPVPAHDPNAEKKAADTSAGKANPFPGGTSTPDMPGEAPEPDAKPDGTTAGSPNSSTDGASSSSSSPSTDDVGGDSDKSSSRASKNPDDDDEVKPKLADKGSSGRRTPKVVKPQSDTARVDEDLSVAKFYGQSGNYMGAYMRAKDAVKTQPEYPEGHFALGEAAKQLKKKDEAVAEFQAYLKLAPDGQQARAAEKALDELK